MLIEVGTFPAICYSFILCSDKQFAVEYAFLVSYPNNFYKSFFIPQHIFKKWFHTPTKSLPPQSVTFLMTAPLLSIPSVLASDRRTNNSILKAEWPKQFLSQDRPF